MNQLFFEPFPFLHGPHSQTIFSFLTSCWISEPSASQKIIALPDGDRLSVEVTTPKEWKSTDPTVLLLHGLCGSHRSAYLVRLARRLEALGIRAARMNMRGCGSGKGLNKKFYHAGRSGDFLEVLKAFKEEHPASPISLIGYSLGGNIALKLAGELQDRQQLLSKVIAVSPPVNLLSSMELLRKPENALYEGRFSQDLRAQAIEFLGKECPPIPKGIRVIEFDELITAPQGGFSSALDYYSKCSSAPYVPKIGLPCKILFAEDDPLVSHSALDGVELPANVQIFKTKRGGHIGFLGNPVRRGGARWLDSLLVSWLHG